MEPLPPGSLWSRIEQVTQQAIRQQALVSIATEATQVEENGLSFAVRLVTSLDRKEKAATLTSDGSAPATKRNPFLPYEEALYLGHFNNRYLGLLNKFNVLQYHFLIVTSDFEEQEAPLRMEDFEAAQQVLREIPCLVFFNGGRIAGASQRHKHLQAIPLPGEETGHKLYDLTKALPLIGRYQRSDTDTDELPLLPFKHRFFRAEELHAGSFFQAYRDFCEALDLQTTDAHPFKPYNLLMTREWMLVVPRSQEHAGRISVNALGYTGAMLARTEEDLRDIRNLGPLQLLRSVSIST